MSVYVSVDGGEPMFLSSNRGWGDFARWVDALSVQQSPEVAHLRQHGWEQDLGKLQEQLTAALTDDVPEDVALVGKELLSVLAAHPDAGAVTVNSGMGPTAIPGSGERG